MSDIKKKFEGWAEGDSMPLYGLALNESNKYVAGLGFKAGAESMHPEISKLTGQNKELILTLKLFIEELEDHDQWKDMVESTIEQIQKVEGE